MPPFTCSSLVMLHVILPHNLPVPLLSYLLPLSTQAVWQQGLAHHLAANGTQTHPQAVVWALLVGTAIAMGTALSGKIAAVMSHKLRPTSCVPVFQVSYTTSLQTCLQDRSLKATKCLMFGFLLYSLHRKWSDEDWHKYISRWTNFHVSVWLSQFYNPLGLCYQCTNCLHGCFWRARYILSFHIMQVQ